MTKMKEEESFPRGRSSSTKPALRKVKDKLFKKHKKPKKTFKHSLFEENQVRGKFRKSASKENHELEPSHQIRPLTYQSLEEGMVVVGRIREINLYHMFICLPGKLSAKVPITAISQPYSNSLARLQKLEITQKDCPPLSDLFTVGQAVVCSIAEVKKDGNVLVVNASLDPVLINKESSHHVIRAGHTLVAAIRTIEDHGYTLHTGIAGLTTFLKFGNAAKHIELKNQGRSLVVGELVRCVVTKCTTARSASRAEVTLDPRVLAETTISDGNAQTLHPGTAVNCVVHQSYKSGLVVNIGRCKAYVEAAQLPSCWSSHKYIQPEEDLTATVIYSLPNTDFQITARPTYLTLKNLSQPTFPKLGIGDIVEARVTQSGSKGLTLCLGEKKDKELGNKGFVSIRRLGEIVPKENIAKKFPKGTVVTTKILGFDFMEEIYNCSLERAKLDQHYISAAQVKVGDRVSCKVIEVEESGLKLCLGPVRLYAFKEHSADKPYDDLRQHFCSGDIVDARVLKVNPATRQVYVTLKETLIRSPALMSYEEASVREGYWGTVRTVNKSKSLYVTFYNDVAGVLNLGDLSSSQFKPGQLVKCFVRKVNASQRRLTLSLAKPKKIKQTKQPIIGEMYQLVVSSVNGDHLEVTPCDFEGIEGMVSKCHLHDPNKFNEGDFIRAWLYHKKGNTHYFSPSPSMEYFFKNPTSIKVRYRMTLCVDAIKQDSVSVLTALTDIPTVDVPKKEWPENEQPRLHQLVRLYVQEYDAGKKILKLTLNKPPKQGNVNNSENDEESANEGKCIVKNVKALKTKRNQITATEEVNGEESTDGAQGVLVMEGNKTNIKIDKQTPSGKKRRNNTECISEEESMIKSKGEMNTTDSDASSNKGMQSKKKRGSESMQDEMKDRDDAGKIRKVCEKDAQKESSTKKRKLSENESDSEEESVVPNEIELNTSDFDSDESSNEMQQVRKKSCSENDKKCSKDNEKPNKLNSSKSETNSKLGVKKLKKGATSISDSDSFKEPNEINTLSQPAKSKPTLSETGFLWDIKPEELSKPSENAVDDIEEEDEDSNIVKKKKKTAADRRQAAKEEEARVRQVEQSLLSSENNPQSTDQFDRAVLARPDDDELWIKYMSHHLQATEIEKARAVARRALQTINQRLEVERLNIWIALLNLENLFGTQESLKNTLDEALRANDEYAVYTKMLSIYSQANKTQETEQLAHTMLRKFRESLECWVVCCGSLMGCGLADKARNLLQRAISALPPKQHVNLLCKFALLENQHGNSEQAQTLFEHILTTYPKRTDIWNVYVDMLVKTDKVNVARQILERATKQKLPPRKMKMLFNKWVSFEEKNGTPEKVEYVRKQALAYVNNITNKLEDD